MKIAFGLPNVNQEVLDFLGQLLQDSKDLRYFKTVSHCSYFSDGRFLASSSWDKTIRIWDLKERVCVKTLFGHQDRVRTCAFLPYGYQLISIGDDQTFLLWDATTGQCLCVLGEIPEITEKQLK